MVPDDFLPKQILAELNELAISQGKTERDQEKPIDFSSMKEIIITLSTADMITDIYMIRLYFSQVSERSGGGLRKTRIRATTKITLLIYFAPSSLG